MTASVRASTNVSGSRRTGGLQKRGALIMTDIDDVARDAALYGTGFMKDGKRVDPLKVFRSGPVPTTSDTSKLYIRDGVIHYKIRQQDGSFEPMSVKDTPSMRMYVQWIQIHD